MRLEIAAALCAIFATASAGSAQSPSRPDCSAAEFRQLNFWIGEWDVLDPAHSGERVIATSRIVPVVNGCAIQENYDAPSAPGGAYRGTSYSMFDRNERQWHQMYVDVNGTLSWYSGGLEDGGMVMTAPGRNGAILRMAYRPHADGTVEQVGTVSSDGGRTWRPGYSYLYRRRHGT
jgi:hypothetical protein